MKKSVVSRVTAFGFILFAAISDTHDQVRALCDDFRGGRQAHNAPITIDQEGGACPAFCGGPSMAAKMACPDGHLCKLPGPAQSRGDVHLRFR